jgi:hypothetical protein
MNGIVQPYMIKENEENEGMTGLTDKAYDPWGNQKMILSTVWIIAVLNFICAAVFNLFFNPAVVTDTAAMSPAAVLGLAVFLELAILMTILARVLKFSLNRWANIIVGILLTALVGWSLVSLTPEPFYVFFAVAEIATTLFIVQYSWRWRQTAWHGIEIGRFSGKTKEDRKLG